MLLRSLLTVVSLLSLLCISPANVKPQKIQVGYCAKLDEVDAAKAAGFDYLELRTSEIAALSDADYERLLERIKQVGIPVPVTYLFIPGTIKLTGPNID